jgi:hypothetical protein
MLVPLLIAYTLAPDTTVHVLAQTEGTASAIAPWAVLFNTGVCGIWLWSMLTGKTHSDKDFQRVVTKLDAAEKELLRRAEEDRTTLIPAVVRATDIMAKVLDRQSDTPPPPSRRER